MSVLAFWFDAGSRREYGRVVLARAVRFEVNPVLAGGEARRALRPGSVRVLSFGQPLTASLVQRTAGVWRSRSK
jgi:hypothetical protein